MITVVDIFSDIVSEVQKVYDPAGFEKPYYMHGHPVEIATILSEKDASSVYKFKKYLNLFYPCIKKLLIFYICF